MALNQFVLAWTQQRPLCYEYLNVVQGRESKRRVSNDGELGRKLMVVYACEKRVSSVYNVNAVQVVGRTSFFR